MNALIALGLGIIVFALIVGVGVVVLTKFGDTVAACGNSVGGGTYNATSGLCANSSGATTAPTGAAYTTNTTLTGYLSNNLITWIPAIIALGVGLLFIGALMGKKSVKV